MGAAGGIIHHGGVAASVGTPVGLGGDDSRVPFPRHFSSNDSNPSLIDDDGGRRSPSIRPRSRSLRYVCFQSPGVEKKVNSSFQTGRLSRI